MPGTPDGQDGVGRTFYWQRGAERIVVHPGAAEGPGVRPPPKNADVFVLRVNPSFECLATNSIGGEPMNASPAVSEGEILIHKDKHLWCIGKQCSTSHENEE